MAEEIAKQDLAQQSFVVAPPAKIALDGRDETFWSSIKAADDVGKARILALMQSESEPLADYIGKGELAITDVLIHLVEMELDKSGEITILPRIVLIDRELNGYSCVSAGVLKSLRAMSAPNLFGPPPWEPALLVRVMEGKTRKKRKFMSLQVSQRWAPGIDATKE